MPTFSRRIFALGLLAIVLPLLAACGDDEDENSAPQATASPPTRRTAAEILQLGRDRLAAVQSIHFRIEIDGTTYIDENQTIQIVMAEGNIVRPDRVQARFQAKIQGLAISSIALVTVGDQSWTTNIITGDWEPAATEFGYDATILFSETEGLGTVMAGAPNPERLPDEELDGRAMYRIHTTGDEALIGAVTSHTMSGYPVQIDLWIDQETGDLMRVVLVEGQTPEKSDPATWTLDLSRQNDEITIEPPDVDGDADASATP